MAPLDCLGAEWLSQPWEILTMLRALYRYVHVCVHHIYIYISVCVCVSACVSARGCKLGRQVCMRVSTWREREKERESAKFNDTIHTPGDTRGQSLSPVTPKQTFLCDVKPWSSLEPNAIRHCSILKCIMTLRCIIGLVSFNTVP